MVHINHVSGDFKCKYRLNFSFKNHFFCQPFPHTSKVQEMRQDFQNTFTITILQMYLEED